ncbi:MAG TPA: hypothetical protein VKE98_23740 [Gemmataceae bacterium]|nr:hypothetical protein [Gemmataceae bacterium]
MKIVINRSHGSFCLSDEARKLLFARNTNHITFTPSDQVYKNTADEDLQGSTRYSMEKVEGYLSDDFRTTWGADAGRRRADANLVAVVEELGERSSGFGAKLMVIDLPDGVDWLIHEIDGKEQMRSREEGADTSTQVSSQIPLGSGSGKEIEYFL